MLQRPRAYLGNRDLGERAHGDRVSRPAYPVPKNQFDLATSSQTRNERFIVSALGIGYTTFALYTQSFSQGVIYASHALPLFLYCDR